MTDTLEPWLAESWTESADHLSFTLKLRPGVVFSDGTPFTSADVVFSFRALYDPRVDSPLASDTLVNGKPLQIEAPDPSTVIVRLPTPFAPGLRLIDGVPNSSASTDSSARWHEGKFNDAWSATHAADRDRRPRSIRPRRTRIGGAAGACAQPALLAEGSGGHVTAVSRQADDCRWRARPSEALKLQAGEIDLMANADIRPDDYAAYKRAADQGRVRLIDGGFTLDPSLLWFNLTTAHAADPRAALSSESVPSGGVVRGRSTGDRQHRRISERPFPFTGPSRRPIAPGSLTCVRPASTIRHARVSCSCGRVDRPQR